MKRIEVTTTHKKILSDVHTPVGIYLRLRDRFRDTILLESTDHHVAENSYSFICVNAIAGIEISSTDSIERKWPNENPEKVAIRNRKDVPGMIWEFMQKFEMGKHSKKEHVFAQGLYGYTSFDAVQFFESIDLSAVNDQQPTPIPLMRY